MWWQVVGWFMDWLGSCTCLDAVLQSIYMWFWPMPLPIVAKISMISWVVQENIVHGTVCLLSFWKVGSSLSCKGSKHVFLFSSHPGHPILSLDLACQCIIAAKPFRVSQTHACTLCHLVFLLPKGTISQNQHAVWCISDAFILLKKFKT